VKASQELQEYRATRWAGWVLEPGVYETGSRSGRCIVNAHEPGRSGRPRKHAIPLAAEFVAKLIFGVAL
jgi:hypothetical protein